MIRHLIDACLYLVLFLIKVTPEIIPEIILSKTQEMYGSFIYEDPISIKFLLRYISDQYKTHRICNKAVGYSLGALTFVPDWFVISKMIKITITAFCTDENILYFFF